MVICSLDALKKPSKKKQTRLKKEIVEVLKQATISCKIFWDFSIFYQIFLSAQVKRWTIISYKYGIYELPNELPNNFRLRILEN